MADESLKIRVELEGAEQASQGVGALQTSVSNAKQAVADECGGATAAGAAELARDFRERYAAAPRILREADDFPAALAAIRGSLAAAPVPRVLEEALAANALNALADEPPTELATLSPESGKWQPRVPAGVREGGRATAAGCTGFRISGFRGGISALGARERAWTGMKAKTRNRRRGAPPADNPFNREPPRFANVWQFCSSLAKHWQTRVESHPRQTPRGRKTPCRGASGR